MGLKRWIKHEVMPVTKYTDAIKNMIDEGSVVEGIKKSVKQNYCEDNPITTPIYEAGKFDGKKEGYVEASDEYEKKLLEQADMFLQQKKDYLKEREEYEALIEAYDRKINELLSASGESQDEDKLLQQLLLKERQLKNIEGLNNSSSETADAKADGSYGYDIINGYRVRNYNP